MKRALFAFLFYSALTIALTYPLIRQLGSVLPHDAGDPALNTWILWWNAQAVPYTSTWWNAPAFYPLPGVLAFSEHLLGLSLIATPIQWLGAEPQVAYNIVFLLTFPLCGLGAYLLALELTTRPAFAPQSRGPQRGPHAPLDNGSGRPEQGRGTRQPRVGPERGSRAGAPTARTLRGGVAVGVESGATARLAHDAAFIAGLLFAFAPYRIAQLAHIQVLAAFAMPFCLLGLHRYLRDPRPRWLALFGAGWLLQAISNGYYLLFFSVLVGMWMLWFGARASGQKHFGVILVAWLVSALPVLPLLWEYRRIHAGLGFIHDFGTIRHFGADAMGPFSAAPSLAFWGWLQPYPRAEGEIFPGLTIVVLVVAGAWLARGRRAGGSRKWTIARRVLALLSLVTALVSLSTVVVGPWQLRLLGERLFIANPVKPLTFSLALGIILLLTDPRLRRAYSTQSVPGFYALAAFLTWLFSLGPAPTLMGEPLMYRGPYELLMYLPGFSSLRVPARFWMMSVLCLTIVGAMVFDRLGRRMGQRRRVAAAIVAFGVLADGWVARFPLAPVPWKAESCGPMPAANGAVMELPLGHFPEDIGAMYRSISHGRPTVNGYSGHFPPHYSVLRVGLSLRDQDVLTQLATHGAADIVVDREKHPDGGWDKYVASHPGAQLICTEGKQSLYRLTADSGDLSAAVGPNPANFGETSPSAAVRRPPANSGETSPKLREGGKVGTTGLNDGRTLPVVVIRPNVNAHAAALMTDGDRTTRWESGPQTEGTMVELDLGAVRTVNRLELALGTFVEDFPRAMAIEASEDRHTWREVWRGGSAGLAFVGAIEAPRDVPLRYQFSATPARYLRMRLTAKDDSHYWSVAELKVLGP